MASLRYYVALLARFAAMGCLFAGCSDSASGGPRDGDGLPGQGEPCEDGQCAAGLFCDYVDPVCGSGECWDDLGECQEKPNDCPTVDTAPVCGCDGTMYASECAAHAAGVDLGNSTCADEAEGLIRCGTQFCDPASSYCAVGVGDACDDQYSCEPLPASCSPAAPSCDCMDFCDVDCWCMVIEGEGQSLLRVETSLL